MEAIKSGDVPKLPRGKLVTQTEMLWRYTHCTYVQYVLVRYKYACYSGPLFIIRYEPS